jgi:hypothetical protein
MFFKKWEFLLIFKQKEKLKTILNLKKWFKKSYLNIDFISLLDFI